MVIDLTPHKIPTFPGINDTPVEPTTTKAGNGAHLISLHNSLIDDVEINLNSLIPPTSTDELTEGTANLYFTEQRVDERVSIALSAPSTAIQRPNTITNGLLSFWKFAEETGIRNDSFGTNNLTPNGTGITRITGKVGNAIEFSNNSSLTTIGDKPKLNLFSNKGYTVSIWVKPTTLNTNQVIFDKDGVFYLMLNLGNKFRWVVANDNGTETGTNCDEVVATVGQWYYVYCTYDPITNLMSIRVNEGITYTSARTLGTLTYANAIKFSIGCSYGDSNYFNGGIDCFGLWDRLLNLEEKAYLFNKGNGTEVSIVINAANQLQLDKFPTTSSSPGNKGDIRLSTEHLYICTEVNQWKRTPLAIW